MVCLSGAQQTGGIAIECFGDGIRYNNVDASKSSEVTAARYVEQITRNYANHKCNGCKWEETIKNRRFAPKTSRVMC